MAVLEHARDTVVVLRRGEENGVGGLDTPLEFGDAGRRRFLFVLVIQGNVVEIENFDLGLCGDELLGGAQCQAVVRGFPQAAGNRENGQGRIHVERSSFGGS